MEGPEELKKKVSLTLGGIAMIIAMTFTLTSIYWRFQQVEIQQTIQSERADKRNVRTEQSHQDLQIVLELEIKGLREDITTLRESLNELEILFYGYAPN